MRATMARAVAGPCTGPSPDTRWSWRCWWLRRYCGPGYLLLRDAVSTPRSYLSDTALGLTSAPRATPQDFAVALASHLIDGGVVVKALLVLGLWLAGWGAARLVATALPCAGAAGQFVAITLAIWNPYVAERLLQGHWSLLVGYGCLPWVATAMLTLRSARSHRLVRVFRAGFWIALAGLTPTGLMLAATVALVCVAAPGAGRPRWLCAAATLGAALVAALPWLTAVGDGRVVDRPRGGERARGHRVRAARRARPWHAGQPGQPRRDLERRGRTQFADNAFRGVVGRWCCWAWWWPGCRRWRVARRWCRCWCWRRCRWCYRPRWPPDPACTCCARWLTPHPASVCCATGRSGWRWRCPDTHWRAPARW